MLDEQPLFKFTFRIIQLAGFWRTENLSEKYKFFTKVIFLWLHPVAIVMLLLSVFQGESVGESARSVFFVCITLTCFGYDGSFVVCRHQIEDLIADLDGIFSENSETKERLVKICEKLRKTKMFRFSVLIICAAFGSIAPLITGMLATPIYTPTALKHTTWYYIFSYLYETIDMLYLITVSTFVQELYYQLLYVINAYTEFFKAHIEEADLSEGGKVELMRCIRYHQNIQR
jgi:hypothetical protein